MTLAQMIARLTRGYIKATGKQPVGLDKLKIKMEAAEKLRQMNKVIPFPQQRSFKQEIDDMIKSGDINIGTASKTPPYQKSQADIDFEIMERIKSDNEKAIRGFESRNPKKPTEDKAYGGVAGLLGERKAFQGGGSDASTTSFSKSYDKQHGTNTASRANKTVDRRQDEGQRQADEINRRIEANRKAKLMELQYPKESVLDKVKNNPYINNPITRTLGRTALYTLNPTIGMLDARKAMQLKNIYDYTTDQINKPVDEEDLTLDLITDTQKGVIDAQGNMGKLTGEFKPDDTFKAAKGVLNKETGTYSLDDKGEKNIFSADRPAEPMTREEFDAYVKAKGYATGGITRQNFAMGRRAFLKLIGGLGAGIGAAKAGLGSLFKTSKPVSKLPIIKTDNVAGKPEWFDTLVNKVILEGDDVTKQFATKEREIVHVKTLEKGSNRIDPNTGEIAKPGTPLSDDVTVKVTQDLDDGVVRVEYDSPESMYGDTVQLQYKKPLPDEGNPRPSAEFEVAESGPVGRADGPDDYSIDIDEVGGTSIKDLSSDVSKLKEYATGKKPTMKEIVQNKKRKDKAKAISEGGEAEQDFIISRQGEFIENDLVDLDPPDLASGGRVGFAFGKLAQVSGRRFLEKIFGKEAMKEMPNRDPEMYQGMLEVVEMFRNRDKKGLKMYLQKFLPHMDDETIEAFIIGDAVDAAGQGKYGLDNIQGQLIRLGSGRDYAGKIEAFKRLERNKTLKDLEVTDKMKRKPNASGGIARMLGE